MTAYDHADRHATRRTLRRRCGRRSPRASGAAHRNQADGITVHGLSDADWQRIKAQVDADKQPVVDIPMQVKP